MQTTIKQQNGPMRTVPCPTSQPIQGSAIFSDQAWLAIARNFKLSGRELQIVRGVFDDQKESTIAANLGISPHTVHTHFERLHRKLEVHDRTQVLIRIMQEFLRLTTPPSCTAYLLQPRGLSPLK